MNTVSASSLQQQPPLFSAPDMPVYLVKIEYSIFGKHGNRFFMYFKPDVTANDVIRDFIKHERLGINGGDLHVEVSTSSINKAAVQNVDESLQMKPGVEICMHIFSREAWDCTAGATQAAPGVRVE
ncbi:hypothetical protein GGI00_001108 [Coemansia sp. RSA 2681]|nr:hypothetical protein GGI00_001108 [Coemansia sp. RSA 2681]